MSLHQQARLSLTRRRQSQKNRDKSLTTLRAIEMDVIRQAVGLEEANSQWQD